MPASEWLVEAMDALALTCAERDYPTAVIAVYLPCPDDGWESVIKLCGRKQSDFPGLANQIGRLIHVWVTESGGKDGGG